MADSKQQVAQKAADKLDAVARDILADASKEGSTILAGIEVAREVAKLGSFLRTCKDNERQG